MQQKQTAQAAAYLYEVNTLDEDAILLLQAAISCSKKAHAKPAGNCNSAQAYQACWGYKQG
jgi:hypothetical protein